MFPGLTGAKYNRSRAPLSDYIFTELVQLGRLYIFIVQRKRLLCPMFSLMDAKNYTINYLSAGGERVALFSSVPEETIVASPSHQLKH